MIRPAETKKETVHKIAAKGVLRLNGGQDGRSESEQEEIFIEIKNFSVIDENHITFT